jgi:ubiquinone/menaquinone biosynthesis C-methylase UbiE
MPTLIKTQSGEIICKEILSCDDIDEDLVGHPDSIYSDVYQQQRIEWLVSELKVNNAEKPILEVGTACGYILNKINGDIGIDIRPDRLVVAKKKYPDKQFYYGNILNLEPFYNFGIKTIIAAEILEHLPYNAAHHAIIHCLRVAPTVYYTVPNSEKDPGVVLNQEHRWYPTANNMAVLLEYTSKHINMVYDIKSDNNFFYGMIRRMGNGI